MITNNTKINLRERLERLRPASNLFAPQRFALPQNYVASEMNINFRRSMADHLYSGNGINGQPLTYSRDELMSKIGDLRQAPDPALSMRIFHEEHMRKALDLFKSTHDPMIAAGQLAEARSVLVTWAFRLAAMENKGNLALAIGGSAVNGVHTFLTDFDFVVLPHREEDREAAKNVQYMMSRILVSIGIDADSVMPRHFDFSTFEELGKRYFQRVGTGNDSNFLELIKKTSASFYRFLMDIRIVDAYKNDADAGADRSEYEKKLDALKDRLVYSLPDQMIADCFESFRQDRHWTSAADGGQVFNIKNNPLRLLHYALYAGRAKLGIRPSSFFEVLEILEKKGVLSNQDKRAALKSLRFFIGLRHLIGVSQLNAVDSAKITDETLDRLASMLGEEKSRLTAIIEETRKEMLEVAQKIFSAIGKDMI